MVTFRQVKSLQKEKMRQRMVVHKVDFIPFAIYQKIKKGVLPQKKTLHETDHLAICNELDYEQKAVNQNFHRLET